MGNAIDWGARYKELEQNYNRLNAELTSVSKKLTDTEALLEESKKRLQFYLARQFGSRSEKRTSSILEEQESLFDEAETACEPAQVSETVQEIKGYVRKKKARAPKEALANFWSVEKVYIDEERTNCDVCGTPLSAVGEGRRDSYGSGPRTGTPCSQDIYSTHL